VIYALKKVLAKSPSARYPTATDFAQALAKGLTWAPSSGELRAVQERMLVTTASQSQVAVTTPRRRAGAAARGIFGLAALLDRRRGRRDLPLPAGLVGAADR
jgi:hypothetical protein